MDADDKVLFPFQYEHVAPEADYHGPYEYTHYYDRPLPFEEDFEDDDHRLRGMDDTEHTFDDREDERLFTLDHYNEAPSKKEKVPHHILSAATSVYLDTTVTKFLQNDISVTKFLESANDVSVTKFLDATVTKFLDENDISVTKFLS